MTRRTEYVPKEPPDLLTVVEAAAVLRISRGKAYKGVRRFIATNGKEGIPAERIDKQFRIPRRKLEEYIGAPITWPIPGFHDIPEPPPAMPPRRKRSKSPEPPPDTQPRLFPL